MPTVSGPFLSQLILARKGRGDLKGIEVAINLYITHFLFVDDIFLFSDGSISDIKHIKKHSIYS